MNTIYVFPTTEQHGCNNSDPGMTLRAYFAAHAPAVPDWFRPARTTPKPRLPSGKELGLSGNQLEQFNGLRNGTLAEENAELPVRAKFGEWSKAERQLVAWQNSGDEERFYAWCWHHANRMLAGMRNQPTLGQLTLEQIEEQRARFEYLFIEREKGDYENVRLQLLQRNPMDGTYVTVRVQAEWVGWMNAMRDVAGS